MRLTVHRVVEGVALYPNRDDLYRNYAELEPDDVQQALAFAAANIEDASPERQSGTLRLADQVVRTRIENEGQSISELM